MATREKNPTNADLLREIRSMQETIGNVVKDVDTLKEWRIALMAVDEYKRREKIGDNKVVDEKTDNSWMNRELVKMLFYALGIIAALVALIQGLKP